MKTIKYLFIASLLLVYTSAVAQSDTTVRNNSKSESIIIISEKENEDSSTVVIEVGRVKIDIGDDNKIKVKRIIEKDSFNSCEREVNIRNKKIYTMYLLGFNIGICNFLPEKNVPDRFEAKSNSTDVHWYLVTQRIKLAPNFTFKWGLDINWRNYRFSDNLIFDKSETTGVYDAYIDTVTSYSKNKLMARYVTVPLMMEIHTREIRRWKSMGITFGAGFGQLINAKQKLISQEKGKQKFNENFGFSRQRIDLLGKLAIGRVVVYGTYGLTPMFREADVSYATKYTPYSIGLQVVGL